MYIKIHELLEKNIMNKIFTMQHKINEGNTEQLHHRQILEYHKTPFHLPLIPYNTYIIK